MSPGSALKTGMAEQHFHRQREWDTAHWASRLFMLCLLYPLNDFPKVQQYWNRKLISEVSGRKQSAVPSVSQPAAQTTRRRAAIYAEWSLPHLSQFMDLGDVAITTAFHL